MPSDSKKREQARKKDAQKKRNQKIATVPSSKDDEKATTNGTTNGATNGGPVEMTEEGEFNWSFMAPIPNVFQLLTDHHFPILCLPIQKYCVQNWIRKHVLTLRPVHAPDHRRYIHVRVTSRLPIFPSLSSVRRCCKTQRLN